MSPCPDRTFNRIQFYCALTLPVDALNQCKHFQRCARFLFFSIHLLFQLGYARFVNVNNSRCRDLIFLSASKTTILIPPESLEKLCLQQSATRFGNNRGKADCAKVATLIPAAHVSHANGRIERQSYNQGDAFALLPAFIAVLPHPSGYNSDKVASTLTRNSLFFFRAFDLDNTTTRALR